MCQDVLCVAEKMAAQPYLEVVKRRRRYNPRQIPRSIRQWEEEKKKKKNEEVEKDSEKWLQTRNRS